MSTLTDLDAFVPENKQVKLGGKEYVLPGDLPMEIFLRINQAQTIADDDPDTGEGGDGAKAMEAVLSTMGDLFAWLAPEDQKPGVKGAVEATLRGRGLKFLMDLVKNVYTEDEAAEGAPAVEDPTPAATTGTPST